jgi:hypothetical protein
LRPQQLKERTPILLKANGDTVLGTRQGFEFFEPGPDRSRIGSNLELLALAICPTALAEIMFLLGPIDPNAPGVFSIVEPNCSRSIHSSFIRLATAKKRFALNVRNPYSRVVDVYYLDLN